MILSKLLSPLRLSIAIALICGLSLLVITMQPQKASADACTPNGRDCYFGYFYNGWDGGPGTLRWNVISAPALLNVFNGWDLVNWIGGYLGGCSNLNSQNQTGAAFIILTMLGAPPGTNKADACARFGEWASIVYNYEANGLVNFNVMHDFSCINTRSTLSDVAWYPSCGAAWSIVFYHPLTGVPIYAIKKDCANPVGYAQAVTLNYDLQPVINATVNGGAATVAEPGDSVNFSFRINNNGGTTSAVVNCDAHNVDHVGYFPTPGVPEGGGANIPVSCPNSFGRFSSTEVGNQTVTAIANRTICRTLFVDPSSSSGGGRRGIEACIPVASKPYVRVFGGDVSVGGGLATAPNTCTNNPNASIMTWNKRGGGGYAGAGSQYGTFATRPITDFASALGNSGGAPVATGLSFANTSTNPASGNFGGNFNGASCITDYYSQRPASVSAYTSLTPAVTGDYGATGNVTMGGNVSPSEKITVYIDGNLLVTSNITYTGPWSAATVPLLKVVVRGNIYISPGVTRMDGIFIAQVNGVTGGNVYTCASTYAPPTIVSGAFYNGCQAKLTVNGALIANSIEFDRAGGTLGSATPGENGATGNMSEVLNFGPAFWMTQPTNSISGVDNYDAITSLPPVL